MTRLFVYGSLLSGLSRHAALGSARCEGAGRLRGAALYTTGDDYPGARLSERADDVVTGELYLVDAATLAALDVLEDYRPDDPEGSLFVRRAVAVERADGVVVAAETYLHVAPLERPIAHGDWRRFLG